MKYAFLVLLLMPLTAMAIDPSAAKVCDRYPTAQQKEDCFLKLKDDHYSVRGAKFCESYLVVNRQVSCLQEIANMSFSSYVFKFCLEYNGADAQKDCLIRNSEPMSVEDNRLSTKLRSALISLGQDNIPRAKEIIREVINELDNN